MWLTGRIRLPARCQAWPAQSVLSELTSCTRLHHVLYHSSVYCSVRPYNSWVCRQAVHVLAPINCEWMYGCCWETLHSIRPAMWNSWRCCWSIPYGSLSVNLQNNLVGADTHAFVLDFTVYWVTTCFISTCLSREFAHDLPWPKSTVVAIPFDSVPQQGFINCHLVQCHMKKVQLKANMGAVWTEL